MNQPRYRVKSLLIATTITAVVVACLAPWLRLIPPQYLHVVLSRLFIVGLGTAAGMAINNWHYHRYLAKHSPSEASYLVESVGLDANLFRSLLFPFGVIVFMALAAEWSAFNRAMAVGSHALRWWSWWGPRSWLWIVVGLMGAQIALERMRPQGATLITHKLFVHPSQSSGWRRGMKHRWIDRESGKLELVLCSTSRVQLQIPVENVDAIDQLLTENIPPTGYWASPSQSPKT